MKRVAVYSTSRARPAPIEEGPEVPRETPFLWKAFLGRNWRKRRIAAGAFAAVLLASAAWTFGPQLRGMSQAEVDAAIQRALEANPPKPTAADAYEKILPSLVHVRGLMTEEDPKEAKQDGTEADPAAAKLPEGNTGTGVVIVDTGIILTNLHVV